MKFVLALVAAVIGIVLLSRPAATAPPDTPAERLARHRNLGKAFFENPTTQAEAVAEFKAALDLQPNSARERLNYGIALLAAGKSAEGIAEIEKVQKQDPSLPHTWFNLGVQFKKAGEFEKAARQFEGMAKRVPDEPITHYNLGTLYKILGDNDKAITEFETASRLDPNLAAPNFQLYNAYRQVGRRDEAADRLKRFQKAKKDAENAPVAEDMNWSFYSEIYDEVDPAAKTDASRPLNIAFTTRRLAPPASPPGSGGLAVLDANGDGTPDVLTWSGGSARLFSGAGTAIPLPATAGVQFAAPADVDNDGDTDILLVTASGIRLLSNAAGKFTARAIAAPAGSYTSALWLDYDHDYDLDLFLFGDRSALLRNAGAEGFSDNTAAFPFDPTPAKSAATLRLIPDSKSTDLVVVHAGKVVVYRDRLAGKFEAQAAPGLPASSRILQVVDADQDGAPDLLAAAGDAISLWRNDKGKLVPRDTGANGTAVYADLENRAIPDLVATSGTPRYPGKTIAPPNSTALAAADFNQDGKLDLASVAADGSVHLSLNQTPNTGRWMRIGLKGIKNPKLAPGSEVEVKAGVRYQKLIYSGVPLHVGLRDYATADAVRITWPNGLIQNEAKQPVGKELAYEEAQRLSGSCPQIWTWNGSGFEYITDVLGVAPLGAGSGDGTYFPTDHLEHILIPSRALAARDGAYEVRLTEELAEVAYIDRVDLIAVDRPAGSAIALNEKFQSPPYPELAIFDTNEAKSPLRQEGGRGNVEVEFAAPGDLLVLSGWIDWPDASQFLSTSFTAPRLEVRNPDGSWRTLLADLGLPAGKPKTVAVPLPEKAAAFRIVTDLPVFWTKVRLANQRAVTPGARTLAVDASLRFRGFSPVAIHPQRLEPERFSYDGPSPVSLWNPTPGYYTRYGSVTDLTSAADDRFVIMGSGDELLLRFPVSGYPPLAPGMERHWVLAVDGWAKDQDANTAYSQTVEPLPFHGMSSYPYPAAERFPDTPAHRDWRRDYNTRPALRLIRPLTD